MASAYRRLESASSVAEAPVRQPIVCNTISLAALLLLGFAVAAMLEKVRVAPKEVVDAPTTALASPSPGQQEDVCSLHVVLARHCDKRPPWTSNPTQFSLCTDAGMLRGQNMARLFGPGGTFPEPSRLYARRMSEGVYASRDLYLLWPLSTRINVLVNTTFAGNEVLDLAAALLEERPNFCGQTVLVSWDHCCIPALAQALGCKDSRCMTCWDDRDYDSLFWLSYTRPRGESWHLSFRVAHERFGRPDGPSSYRECANNPLEGSNFGYACEWVGASAT